MDDGVPPGCDSGLAEGDETEEERVGLEERRRRWVWKDWEVRWVRKDAGLGLVR